jgi:hypothetical protein
MRATELLTINGYDLSVGNLKHSLHPREKPFAECLHLQSSKNPAQSIMRWNTIFQVEKLAQSCLLLPTKVFNIGPPFSAGHDST